MSGTPLVELLSEDSEPRDQEVGADAHG
jgi:hypothetical protein